MERGFKYRIYPDASQRDQITRTLGCCRFVYNRALDVKKSAYAKTGKTVSWAELSRMLPAWKRDSETSWLAQADSMALQQSVRDLDRAYKNFFRRVREGGRTLVKVGRFYPSSKTCSACGHRLDALPLSVRSWDCPACGAHHDRDVNAARNILAEGKRILSNTEGTVGHAGTGAAVAA